MLYLQKGHPSRRFAPQGEDAFGLYIVIPDLIRDPGPQARLVRVALDTRRRGCDGETKRKGRREGAKSAEEMVRRF